MADAAGGMHVVPEGNPWLEAVNTIETDLRGGNLDLWLRHARFLRVEGGLVHVEVLNEFCRDWIRERYLHRIIEVLSAGLGTAASVEFHLAQAPDPAEAAAQPVTQPAKRAGSAAGPRNGHAPNPRYTFDRFVEGPCNQLAAEVAKAIAARPQQAAHPLYIHAASGLGKSHLLSAVGNAVLGRNSRKRVLCLSMQRFVEEFVQAVRSYSIEAFDRRYREDCDLLLLDDVHVLRGKDGTQERFFHIFNVLHDRQVPIVLTSDLQPKELPGMDERLRTRFAWGLIVDIQPPEFETRLAILRKKAEEESIVLPGEVAELVAERVNNSIRELEGTLARLAVEARLARSAIDTALARKVLGSLAPVLPPSCSIDDIQRAVCAAFGISPADLRGTSRRRDCVIPRHVAMYLAREGLHQAYPAIGRLFGDRDHSTVIAACRNVARLIRNDRAIAGAVANLRRQLGIA